MQTLNVSGSCLMRRCDVVIDPQPKQGWIGSWFRSKKAAGYKPDLVQGTLKKAGAAIDSCTGNWLHHLEWEKGVKKPSSGGGSKSAAGVSAGLPGGGKRLWDRKSSPAPSSVPVDGALPSDCRHREDVVFLKARSALTWHYNGSTTST